MRTLALIENDVAFAAELRRSVEAEGFRTECFPDGGSAIASVLDRPYALAIIDLGVGGVDPDPFELCRTVSAQHPVIALTTDRSDETCVRALESGADDCICRPFPLRELVARIRNVLTRVAPEPGDEGFAWFADAMRVRVDGRMHNLTRGEAEVLALLVESAPRPLTIEQMLAMLPSEHPVKRGTIESRIKSLRRKLGERLVSRGRFGYQLRADSLS